VEGERVAGFRVDDFSLGLEGKGKLAGLTWGTGSYPQLDPICLASLS